MKLLRALELAEECGLETVGEAIRNVRIHSPSLFKLEEIDAEIHEMMTEWYRVLHLCSLSVNRDSSIKEVIDIVKRIDGKESEG